MLISLSEVAKRLGVLLATARKISPQLPGAVLVSKRIRYNEYAINQFITAGMSRHGQGNAK